MHFSEVAVARLQAGRAVYHSWLSAQHWQEVEPAWLMQPHWVAELKVMLVSETGLIMSKTLAPLQLQATFLVVLL
jgi:hypothetical protein